MKTVKLFDKDSFLSEFEAVVLSSEKSDEFYKIILDKTCFFPEAGGQVSDIGRLGDGGVFDVQIENDEIVHYCNSGFTAGEKVLGKIDFKRRFSLMQNHSGEHIVSGIIHKKFGFDNVGFHLNEELVTFDFNGLFSKEQLAEIEYLANKVIWENRDITAFYPANEQLKTVNYRSKKEIDGDLRLVKIDGVDICACCAPHVKSTGQVGLIKFLATEKMRGGTRIYMKCGEYALKEFVAEHRNAADISNALSVKKEEIFQGVLSLKEALDKEKQNTALLKKRLISLLAEQIGEDVRFVEGLSMPQLQKLCDLLYKKDGKTHTVFSENENGGYSLVISGIPDEVNLIFEKAKKSLEIKGGGRNGMISCLVTASKEDILKEFSN